MIKIVYLIHATHGSGGMERVLAVKSNYLTDRRIADITIVTTDQKGKEPYFPHSPGIRFEDLGIDFIDIQRYGLLRKTWQYLRKKRQYRRKLTQLLKAQPADIVISMYGPEASFLYKIKDRSKKLLEIHFTRNYRQIADREAGRGLLFRLISEIRSRMEFRAVSRYDRFIALTKEDARKWKTGNISVIYNPLTINVPPATAPLNTKRVISVGRFEHQKGFDYLIEAWAKVSRLHPDWRCDIFGSGSLQSQLQQQIEHLNIADTLHLNPTTPAITEEYLRSSIYVLSSRHEGLPLVLIEAASCGLPLVTYACECGPRDLIEPEHNGLIVDRVGDTDALAQAINRLIEDSNLRQSMGPAAKETSAQFQIDSIMDHWIRLFEQVLRQ